MKSISRNKLIVKVGDKKMVFTKATKPSRGEKKWRNWQIANSYAAYLAGLQTWQQHQDLIEELETPIQQTGGIDYRLETI